MKVTAIARLKHGTLYEALKRTGLSQKALAEEVGVAGFTIGQIFNLTRKPSFELSEKIRLVMSCHGEHVDILEDWPEDFNGFDKPVVVAKTSDLSGSNLLAFKERLSLPAYSEIESEDTRKVLEEVMETLTPRESMVLSAVSLDGIPQVEVARILNVTRARVEQIHKKAMLKMRCPTRMKKLRTALY